MTKINYKSDFKLVAPLPKTLNFIFHYTTDESVCYDVSIENGRAIVQDDNLIIVFEDHKLPEGQLKVRKEYLIDDEDAKDDILDIVTGEYLDIFLLDCKTDQFKGIVVEEELTIYRGYSAYQIAVKNGFVGTEEEWLESLKQPAKDAATEAENKVNALVNEGHADLAAIKSDYSTFIGNTRTEIDGLIENADEAVTKANNAVITATDAATRAQDAVTRANTAISDANTAATAATSAANSATTAANNANNATAQFNTKLSEINTAITNATNATTNANSATVSATNAASAANSAAEYATTEGSKVAPLIDDVREFMEDNQETIDDMVDKVETFDKRVDDLQLFKTPNLTLFGNPTVNEGQISGFSATDYAAFPFLVDFKNRPFEINMCLTTATNLSGQHNIFDSDFGLALAIRERKIVLAASTNGVSWDLGEHVGTSTLPTNTTVYLKLVYDGTTYTMYYSLDKTTYNTEFTFTGGALYPKQIIIGKSINNANYFNGSINLNNCYLLIDGLQIWQGMDDAGLATRLATDLSNIDAAGEDKIQELVSNKANIDGYYAMFGAGTADNLAARGDSYEVEFGGTRKTGGDLDVEEGSATIKSIKGRTLVFNQLCKNADFSQGSTYYRSINDGTFSVEDGIGKLQCASNQTGLYCDALYKNGQTENLSILIDGHFYVLIANIKTTSPEGKIYFGSMNNAGNTHYVAVNKASSDWQSIVRYVNGWSISPNYRPLCFKDMREERDEILIKYIQVIDVTQMFGAGNEPATAEEFANRLGYNSVEEIPYFEYNEGELINNDVKSITSTVPNEEPFVRLLPTNKYFPDGLKSVGSAYDEMTSTKAIKRIGVVDLGTLSWAYTSGASSRYTATLNSIKLSPQDVTGNLNIIGYNAASMSKVYGHKFDKCIASHNSVNSIWIYDKDLDGITAAEFKAAMQGVLLYYELAEPEETEYDELNLMYNVHPLGTETVEFNTDGVHTYRGEHIYGLDFYTTVKSLLARVKALEGK